MKTLDLSANCVNDVFFLKKLHYKYLNLSKKIQPLELECKLYPVHGLVYFIKCLYTLVYGCSNWVMHVN